MKTLRLIASGLTAMPVTAILLLAGCGGDAPTPAPVAAPVATAATGAPGWLDGEYQGTRTPDVGNPDCGFEASVGYDVSGTSIQLRTRKQRRALAGVIDPSGHFSMTSGNGQQQVVGMIRGSSLTATETQPPHHHRHSGNEAVQGGVCTAEIAASRVTDTAPPPP